MKILYVSQYFPPEMGAPAARAAELSQHWQRMGHEITVLTGFPNHPTGVVPPTYRARLRRLTMTEDVAGVKVVRTWLWPLPNRKAHERILNYASFCVSAAIAGLFLSQPDVVIATSPQLLVGLSGLWLSRCQQAPFVFEVRDLWPESLVAVGMARPGSFMDRALSAVAQFLYRRADHIVVVTRSFKEHLRLRWKVDPNRVSVVENGVDTDLFTPGSLLTSRFESGPGSTGRETNPEPFQRRVPPIESISAAGAGGLRAQLHAEGRFLVGYIGTMGIAHALDTVLEAAQMLKSSAPQVAFLMVGEGADKQRVKALARTRGLDNMIFVDQQPRDQVPAYICACDVCLAPLKHVELFTTVIPTKLLEFMACARPVILGVDGEARELLQEANAGLYVEPENARQLAAAITRLAGDPALRERMGQNGRLYVMQHLSRKETARRYLEILHNLLHRQNS